MANDDAMLAAHARRAARSAWVRARLVEPRGLEILNAVYDYSILCVEPPAAEELDAALTAAGLTQLDSGRWTRALGPDAGP